MDRLAILLLGGELLGGLEELVPGDDLGEVHAGGLPQRVVVDEHDRVHVVRQAVHVTAVGRPHGPPRDHLLELRRLLHVVVERDHEALLRVGVQDPVVLDQPLDRVGRALAAHHHGLQLLDEGVLRDDLDVELDAELLLHVGLAGHVLVDVVLREAPEGDLPRLGPGGGRQPRDGQHDEPKQCSPHDSSHGFPARNHGPPGCDVHGTFSLNELSRLVFTGTSPPEVRSPTLAARRPWPACCRVAAGRSPGRQGLPRSQGEPHSAEAGRCAQWSRVRTIREHLEQTGPSGPCRIRHPSRCSGPPEPFGRAAIKVVCPRTK